MTQIRIGNIGWRNTFNRMPFLITVSDTRTRRDTQENLYREFYFIFKLSNASIMRTKCAARPGYGPPAAVPTLYN